MESEEPTVEIYTSPGIRVRERLYETGEIERYRGQRIAIADDKIVGSAETLGELVAELERKGLGNLPGLIYSSVPEKD